jgi:hypothetical protein
MLAACGGSGSGLNSKPSDLVATWRLIPASFSNTPVDQRLLFTFGADGTVARDKRGGQPIDMGTYTADTENITWTFPGQTQAEVYLATADRLMLGPMTPTGDLDGLAGTWHVEAKITDSTGTTTITEDLTLNADHTSHQVETTGTSMHSSDGTWTETEAEVINTITVDNAQVHDHLARLPGFDVLGGALFEKI